jgi:hypothetical protein
LRCKETGIKLNKAKLRLNRQEVAYMGNILTPDGIKPDPNKVAAVVKMPSPTGPAGVQWFSGMANYLGRFLLGLAELCEPLRHLTKKGMGRSPRAVLSSYQACYNVSTCSQILRFIQRDGTPM